MKKWVYLSIIVCLSLGCSAVQHQGNQQSKFEKIDNSDYVIGNKSNAIKSLVYTEYENEKVDKKITLYIEEFPFNAEFNLCDKFERNLSGCKSSIQIDKVKNIDERYFGQIKIVFPQEFDRSKNKVFGTHEFQRINASLRENFVFGSIQHSTKQTLVLQNK